MKTREPYKSYPVTKSVVAYQQGAHVQCDVERDSEMELEKRRRPAIPESRSGESCWRSMRKSEPRQLSTEKRHTTISTSVSFDQQNRDKRSDERPKTVRSILPRKAVEVN